MSFKKAAVRSVIIIAIALVSVLFGIIFQNLSDKAERSKYPLKFEEFVSKYSYEFGVPKNVIYSVIKCESNFDSSLLSEDGKIGLMQLPPEVFEEYKTELHDSNDVGILYDPESNIKYGTYRLSKMYIRVGTWKSVFASLDVGADKVCDWLEDKDISEIAEMTKPKLINIPDAEVKKHVEQLEKVSETYKRLYFEDR